MYLSRIEIFGFKSFSQKLSLEIGSGITAIVGPNGCGKTNVVDAIRWCLGEQSTKTLRSDKMEDVIFSGTRDEKPLSLSEVTLVFSNDDGQLPLEYREVGVTRRLYRSGESEYLLNNQTCRLKDIVDLFLNTGLGADSYSMIESKMIETILSEDPSIRRSLFEEAAGVAKYRLQKKAAQRRLESTTEDLLRVQDLITEVEKKVRSLKRQATKARVHGRFTQELKEVELKVAALDRDRLAAETQALSEAIGQAEQRKAGLTAELDRHEQEMRAARESLEANENEVGALQDQIAAMAEQIKLEEYQIGVIKERRAGIEQAMRRREQEVKGLLAAIGRFEDEAKALQAQLGTTADAALSATEQLRLREADLSRIDTELTSAKLALGEARRELLEAQRLEAQSKEAVAILESRRDGLDQELTRGQSEEQGLSRAIAEESANQSQTEERIQAESRALSVLAEEKARLKTQTNDIQNQLFLADHSLSQTASDFYSLRKERELLAGLQERGEGYGPGVQYLLSRRSELPGRVWPLAELVTVPAEHRPAIESLLAERLQWLVAGDEATLQQALALLREDKRGKAVLVNLAEAGTGNTTPLLSGDGVVGRAADFVRCEPEFRPLVEKLLGDALIVDSPEALGRVRRTHPHCRAASLSGESVDQSGAIMAGQLPQGQLGLLERAGRLEQLVQEIAAAQQRQADQAAVVEDLKRKLVHLQQRAEEVDREHERYQRSLGDQEKGLARLKATLERHQHRLQEVEAQSAGLRSQVDQLEAGLAAARDNHREIVENNREEEESLALREQGLQHDEARRLGLAQEVNNLRLGLSEIQSQADRWRSEIANIEARRDETMERIQSLQTEDQAGFSQLAELQQQTEAGGVGLETKHVQRQSLLSRREALQKESHLSFGRLKATEVSLHETRLESEGTNRQLSASQLQLSSVRNELTNIAQRIRSDYELELASLERPEMLDLTEAQARIADLRLRLKKLGPINFASFEELQAEEERFGFLTRQRDDLVKAKDDLVLSIRKIDETAKAMFSQTLEGIKKGFIQIFQRLFIGGEADIRLIGSDDPLESEIEILATPLGKNMKSITLLSGGEKALTAIALLFGIYLVKPAPFCVLDEVDAPLDDANVQRFCAMLKDFVGGTQFMVITHNKRTMEIADRLYGVTMEQPGVSKVVSVKFD